MFNVSNLGRTLRWALGVALCGSALSGLAACGSSASDEPAGGYGLGKSEGDESSSYLLEQSTGWQPLTNTKVYISISNQYLGFSAGCNHYSSAYQVQDGVLSVLGFGSTAMGCEGPLHAQDEWLASFFGSGPSVTVDGDRVVFSHESTQLTFLDRELAEPPLALVGTSWRVNMFIQDQVAMFSSGSQAQLAFHADDTFLVEGPCNTIEGQFTASARVLAFSDITTTQGACTGEDDDIVVEHLNEIFASGNVDFEISANQLKLQRGAIGLGAQAE